ncbi:MAG TPA: autotransporter domain-containing protein, partial [Steroidobacter sp.]|nr:autotransporter domain-containing protein [Steroidobacter sp.]
NTYIGGTIINDGRLIIDSGGSLASTGAVNLTGTGIFDISAANDQTIGSLSGVAGSSVFLGGTTLSLSGDHDARFDGSIDGTGGLVKTGAGTQTLAGANTFSGGVQWNAGGLVLGDDAALGTGTLTVSGASALDSTRALALANDVTLNSGLTLAGSNDLTFNGVIDGVGGLTKNGNAALTLNGANTFAGGTTVTGGSLILGNDAALGTGSLTIDAAALQANTAVTIGNDVTVTDGGLIVQGTQNVTLNGAITGSGALVKQGSSTLALGGSLAFTGGLAVNGGTLDASSAYAGNIALGEGATAKLSGSGNVVTAAGPIAGNLDLGNDSSFNVGYDMLSGVTGTVRGLGANTALNITGDGEANLSGASFDNISELNATAGTLSVTRGTSASFTGGAHIGGNLVVNGTLSGPVTISAGGGLVGGGTIEGAVTVNGILAPSGIDGVTGAAAGTFAANGLRAKVATSAASAGSVLSVGSLTLGLDSSTQIRVSSTGAGDSIHVNGAAALGGELVVLPENGMYAATNNYSIIDASGGITGGYASIIQDVLPFLDASVSQQGSQLILTLTQDMSFDQFAGLNNNQRSMARALQAVGTNSGDTVLPTLLGHARGLTNEQVVQSFDTLTGETYASAVTAGLIGQSQYQDMVFYRTRLARDTEEQEAAVWALPYTSSSDLDRSANAASADYRIDGVVIGTDAAIMPDLRIGVHANLASSRTSVGQRNDQVDVDQYAIGFHAQYENEQQWWAESMASYGWQYADSERHIAVGTLFTPRAIGSYDGKSINAAFTGGYRFQLSESMHLEPFAGAYYAKLKYDDFNEKRAGDADLKVGRADATSLQYGVGARFVGDFLIGEQIRLHPVATLRYLHNTKDDTVTVENAFAGAASDTFTVQGSRPLRNHWQAGVGVSFDITPKVNTFLNYNADFSDRMRSDAANVGVRWSF